MSELKKKQRHFGAYLSRKRAEAGLSQDAAAAGLGYSARYFLSRIENNRVSLPFEKIPQIAALYSIPLQELAQAVIEEQTRILVERVQKIVKNATPRPPRQPRKA